MTYLLSTDALPYRVLSGWVALVRASLMWLVFCLPVVTAPAATVVLLRTVNRIRSGQTAPDFAESWRLVRAHFWTTLRLAGLVWFGYAVIVSALVGPSPGGVWDAVLPFVIIPVAATWVLACQWAFAVIEERSDGAWAALRTSYLRAISRPDLAAASALGVFALPAVGLLLPTTVWLPYWLTVPSLWAVLVTVTHERAAARARLTHPGGPRGRSRPEDRLTLLIERRSVPHEDQRSRSCECSPPDRRSTGRTDGLRRRG
jgi:uncharacterized membrane protein YesL